MVQTHTDIFKHIQFPCFTLLRDITKKGEKLSDEDLQGPLYHTCTR